MHGKTTRKWRHTYIDISLNAYILPKVACTLEKEHCLYKHTNKFTIKISFKVCHKFLFFLSIRHVSGWSSNQWYLYKVRVQPQFFTCGMVPDIFNDYFYNVNSKYVKKHAMHVWTICIMLCNIYNVDTYMYKRMSMKEREWRIVSGDVL